jgi:hypothetical protein
MNTIKKTTLIAVITAMAAIAVPSMASAAVWGPLNTNKTLTAFTGADTVQYALQDGGNGQYGFLCSHSTLGVHVRTPASSILDITSASLTGCTGYGPGCGTITVTATGLPWAVTTVGTNVTFTEHLLVNESCIAGYTLNVDGPATGSYSNATHTLTAGPASGMWMSLMGTNYATIRPGSTAPWKDATNTLTLT